MILPQMSAGEGDLGDLLSQDLRCRYPVGGWAPPAAGRLEDKTFCLSPAPLVCTEQLHQLALLRKAFLPGPVGHEDPDSL